MALVACGGGTLQGNHHDPVSPVSRMQPPPERPALGGATPAATIDEQAPENELPIEEEHRTAGVVMPLPKRYSRTVASFDEHLLVVDRRNEKRPRARLVHGTDVDASKQLSLGLPGGYLRGWGAWPDRAWLSTGNEGYRWTGKRWTAEVMLSEDTILRDVHTLPNEGVLMVLDTRQELELRLRDARRPKLLPVGKMHVNDLLVTKDGTVVLAGMDASDPSSARPIVHRWAPGASDGAADVFPSWYDQVHRLLELADGTLVAGLGTDERTHQLSFFDGKRWAFEFATPFEKFTHLAATPDGALWGLTQDEELMRLDPARTHWTHVDITIAGDVGENECYLRELWVSGSVLWAICEDDVSGERDFLLRIAAEPSPRESTATN